MLHDAYVHKFVLWFTVWKSAVMLQPLQLS